MRQQLFDFDLKRVSREHYITGKTAINFPHAGSTTGGWHFLSYFDREAGMAKLSLAGIHYPDTTGFFGDAGVIDVTEQLAKRGWFAEGRRLFMADHHRAAADMIVRWALSEAGHCNVELADWFPLTSEQARDPHVFRFRKTEAPRNGQTAKNRGMAKLAVTSVPRLGSSRIQLPAQL